MEKIFRYTGKILLAGLIVSGCSNYLKEDSGDLLIPKKVEEYAPMLYKEGYPSEFNSNVAWFKLMTDDVEMGHLELDPKGEALADQNKNAFDVLEGGEGKEAYIWGVDIESKLMDGFWDARYKNILACNVVIKALPEMEYVEQDSGKYNHLAAQAYALRAYHYWCLVNTYALPYAEENLDKAGVVLRTEPEIDIKERERSSIRETYKLINEDIKKAEKYMEVSTVSGNKHLLTQPAVWLLGSRIALFQENWDEVIRLGELFVKNNQSVFDLNTISVDKLGADSDSKGFCMMDGLVNPEIVFTFGNSSNAYDHLAVSFSGHAYGLGFRPSKEAESSLLKSYEEGDLRLLAYFKQDVPAKEPAKPWEDYQELKCNYQYPIKYRRVSSDGAEKPNEKLYRENWRTVEVLLNLAEAYVRKSNTISQPAIDLLNTLRKGRISADKYSDKQVADYSSSDDLLRFIWAERRRELCFEEAMRFWDLRRQGMPSIEHRWYVSWDTYETYVLPEESANYVLAIPSSEIMYNAACSDNVREVIKAK